MAELNFEPLHPQGHRGASLIEDLKAHRTEVIIGGVAILVTIMLYLRSQGGGKAPAPAAGATPGNLATGGSTSVSTDMLAAAMQQLSSQESQDIQGIYGKLGSLVGVGAGGGGQTGPPPGGGSSGSSGGIGNTPGNPPVVQGNTNPPQPWGHVWLSQNQSAWDAFISGGAVQGAGISPAWAALYVAQNQSVPANINQWNSFLNAQGVRNPQTGALSGAAGQPPSASLQQQIRNAFGFGLGFSNT